MNYKCPKCNIEYSSIAWDTATLKAKGQNKINDFSDDDIESIEMQIPNYSYICPGCGAESVIGIAGLT
ncbi:hypothetical protein UF75_5337 [Desulfosporosinus sp. I2]|uniref:hypothetical protein n=1 Tax=Desulfosporosinus sp. I2 TaxID=1617025 RepID=UPI0005EFCC35|nr:hypothetical protein [Desulfosporosinus sp. I2]KJR44281.1 hypothetical protein UF75_5337 [Desulfosporosinus sp. I2]